MHTIFVRDTFAAAHRLESYHGKCEQLHGHNFTVEVLLEGDTLSSEGMLVDFATVKGHLREVLAELDHKYINEVPFFRERASTSEYMAFYIFEQLRSRIAVPGVTLKEVRVWESANAYAAYRS
jgi:6-pyruvoyltetrahydropterin/6-carboxytetrahydropterin synthase